MVGLNIKLPPFVELKVGPFTKVPLFPPLDISVHVVLKIGE